MKVYLENFVGEKTIGHLPFFTALKFRLTMFLQYNKKDRPATIKFII